MSVTAVGYRLSPQQKRVWQLLRANNENGCIVEGALLIGGRIESPVIEEWLDNIVQRHEILRTKFQAAPGSSLPIQVVSDRKFHFDKIIDLSDLDVAKQGAEVEKLKQEARRPFLSYEEETLMRATLVTLSLEKKLLLISLSAMCADRAGLINLAFELGRNHFFTPGRDVARGGPAQYADLAGILNGFFEHDEMQDGREYWRSQIDAELFDARLPYVTSALERQDFSPELVSRYLGGDQEYDCGELLRSPSHSASVYLLACYAALLYRLTGSPDLMIGTSYTVRSYEELADTIGPMEKYLPIRCRVEPGAPLADLAQQLSDNCQEAEVWQESFTWDDVISATEREQELLYFPFQFEYWEMPDAAATYPVQISLVEIQGHLERFDLKLRCVRHADTFDIQIHYDPSVMRADAAARLVDEIITLIQSATRQKNEAIDRLNLLGRRERAELLTLAAGPRMPIPVGAYIHELIDRQGCQSIAVRFEDMELTYDSLAIRSNQLARHLQSLGVGEGARVGIYLKRSPDVVISILSVLKSGGAYVPLDPEYPQARLNHILKDAEVRVTLTHSDLVGRLSDSGALPICLDSEWEEIARQSAEQVRPVISPESIAYVIYTSGSTGIPKGVCVSHRNLLSSTMARRVFYESAPDCFLLLSPIAFDSSVAGVFWTLLEGGTLALPPENAQRDPMQIAQILGRDRISHTLAVPALYHHILEAASPEQASSLRAAIVAGEACPSHLPRLHMSKASNADLFNEYGPTEGAVWSTGCRYAADSSETKMPIGKPIANTNAYVVDASGELAPMGVAGELLIGGGGIARGYLNQAGMTAERFVPNPFSHRAGERVYRTGDLVRWGEDNKLEFLGRIDHQVKIRGYRIELGDIEAALNGHHQVKQSVVIAGETNGGGKRLLGYVVVEDGLTAGELKRHVREKLPEYMAPEVILVLEEMPLTANGKVDRKKLLTLEGAVGHLEQKDVVPRTPVEEILLGIFKEVLKLDRVGRGDNFFEIGGHSLLATQVVSRVRSTFGVGIRVGTIFEESTVEGLARRTEEMIRAGEKDEAPPLVRTAREGRAPLSFAQQRLWFLDQLAPNSPFYNCPGAMRLEGRLDLEVLERVINEIVRRHEVLRTRFEVVDGDPVQVVDAWEYWRLEVEDLRSLPLEEREEEARRRAREEAGRSFDLSKGPLLRVKALKLEEEEHVLVYTMHHIVSDGWSMEILKKEVGALYQAYSAGETSPLEDLEIQYADYAVWQREWLKGEALEAELEYWRKQLQGMEDLRLPTDHPRPAAQSHRGASHRFAVEGELVEKLRELGQRENVTMFMTLLTTFKILLGRYSGQQNVAVGTVIANRNRLETESLIGFFVNQLVLRSDLRREQSFLGLLRGVRQTVLESYAHQDLPFEQVVEEVGPKRDIGRSPLCQVMFALQNTPQKSSELPGLSLSGFGVEAEIAKYDLTVTMEETSEGLFGVWGYCRDLFEEETIQRMVGHFKVLLRSVVRNPIGRLSELEALTDTEREQILVDWNQTQRDYPREQCVHQLIEAQANLTPDAVAVVYEGHELSYGELNRRANLLAEYLRGLGVGPEVLVSLCLERSLEMVVGVLGVLKAGGAYVPLDPSYPVERLAYMVEDSLAPVLLTEGRIAGRLPAGWTQIVLIDEWEEYESGSMGDLESLSRTEDLAYVIYTSGSTGRPKGVCITHRGLMNYLSWALDAYGAGEPHTTPLHSSLSFDLTVTSLYLPLLTGGRVSLPEENGLLSPLNGALGRAHNYSLVKLTPSHLQLLNHEEWNEKGRIGALVIGGEALRYEDISRWRKEAPLTRLINEYGPTETVVGSCVYEVCEGDPEEGPVPIGRPIGNTRLYVSDVGGQLTPVGVTGELYIGGEGLGRGYLNRPDLTADRFVPDPFGSEAGKRVYRTGDLVSWEGEGILKFLGRIDEQVKVRGYRIELGEIEAVLCEYPGVKQSVVVVREDEPELKRLVAYVVAEDGYNSPPGAYVLPNGIAIAQQNKNETEFLYEEIFERRQYLRYGIEMREGSCVFDVGANIGLFTLFIGEHCPGARIYAFEPIEDIYRCLKQNATRYDGRVKVFQHGLSDREKEATFTYYPRYSMMSRQEGHSSEVDDRELVKLYLRNERQRGVAGSEELLAHADELLEGRFEGQARACRLRRLSDVMKEQGVERIDLLKIDVERAEEEVLAGVEDEDWEKIDQIVMEAHDEDVTGRQGRVQAIVEGLKRRGYVVGIEEDEHLRGTGMYNLYARRAGAAPSGKSAPTLSKREMDGAKTALTTAELREYLQRRLPDHMVPGAFVIIERIPLTANGKLDRRALPAPGGADTVREYQAPVGEIEIALALIWAEALKLERVGRDDNFFELGGHSLLMISLIERMRQQGFYTDVRTFYATPTLAAVAATVTGASDAIQVPATTIPNLGKKVRI
jgi:amino acid adenylation domain-containing protein/FkbM family methyltransferase